MTIFRRMGRQMTKINITFMENKVPITVLKLFPGKITYRLNESQKTIFGGTFSPVSVVLLRQLFPKTIGFTHVWIRANYVNFMKIGSILWPVSWHSRSILTLLICNPKMKSATNPHLPPSEVESVRLVIILFQNIAKNHEKLCRNCRMVINNCHE